MLRKFIHVKKKKKTHINKEGKAYLTPICRICYRKKTLIGVLFEKSSLKVFFSSRNLLLRYSFLDLQDAELTWGLFEVATVTAKFQNCLNAYIT